MEFIESVKQLSARVSQIKGTIATEEGTKMSLIVPLFQILGYDVFNPLEFCPEYTADVGIKKGEKIDYAILENGQPTILIECKACTENLDKHSSQLFRYFGTTTAKFGILTNGLIYRFYTDLEQPNKMDLVPFLEIDMENIKDAKLNELKKFCKSDFDKDKIFSTAEELKYTQLMRDFFAREFDSPSDGFVRLVLSNVYDGLKNQRIIEKFTPLIKKSYQSYISEIVNNKISSALTKEDPEPTSTESTEDAQDAALVSKITTTEEEIEAFYIIRGMLAGITDVRDITRKDTESYFGILYRDNSRKPICRLKLDGKIKQLLIPDENKVYGKIVLESLNDLYQYKDALIAVVNRYINPEA